MKSRKYNYINVIQQNYAPAHGWEDVSEYPAKSNGNSIDTETAQLIKHDVKEYRLTGYPTRIIFRRELIEDLVN